MAAVIIDEIHMSDRFMSAAPLSMYNPSTENNTPHTHRQSCNYYTQSRYQSVFRQNVHVIGRLSHVI